MQIPVADPQTSRASSVGRDHDPLAKHGHRSIPRELPSKPCGVTAPHLLLAAKLLLLAPARARQPTPGDPPPPPVSLPAKLLLMVPDHLGGPAGFYSPERSNRGRPAT